MHHHNPSLRFDPRFDAAIQTARQDQDTWRAFLHERWLGLARLHLISLKADLDALRQDLIARRKPAYPAPLMGAAPPSRKYSPDQPRLPGGQSGGGQWTSGAGGSSSASDSPRVADIAWGSLVADFQTDFGRRCVYQFSFGSIVVPGPNIASCQSRVPSSAVTHGYFLNDNGKKQCHIMISVHP
jgi:hypothetical protein